MTPEQDEVRESNYKRKMILKLYNEESWDIESIALELQISQPEVEFILNNPE